MKNITGRLTLSKFVVVEYVTLSLGWLAVCGSHSARWKHFLQIKPIAWSSEDVMVKRIECYQKNSSSVDLDEERTLLYVERKQDQATEGHDVKGEIYGATRDWCNLPGALCIPQSRKQSTHLRQNQENLINFSPRLISLLKGLRTSRVLFFPMGYLDEASRS